MCRQTHRHFWSGDPNPLSGSNSPEASSEIMQGCMVRAIYSHWQPDFFWWSCYYYFIPRSIWWGDQMRNFQEPTFFKSAFIVHCNAAALPMYRLHIYRRSMQRTAPQVNFLAVRQCSSRRRDGNTTTATYYRSADALDYEQILRTLPSQNES